MNDVPSHRAAAATPLPGTQFALIDGTLVATGVQPVVPADTPAPPPVDAPPRPARRAAAATTTADGEV